MKLTEREGSGRDGVIYTESELQLVLRTDSLGEPLVFIAGRC